MDDRPTSTSGPDDQTTGVSFALPEVRKYNDNFFIVIPLLRLTEEAKRRCFPLASRWHRTGTASTRSQEAEHLQGIPHQARLGLGGFESGKNPTVLFLEERKNFSFTGPKTEVCWHS